MGEQDQVQGTVFRGADGTLYFIPADDLEAFQIPEERQDVVEDAIEHGGTDELNVSDARIQSVTDIAGPTAVLGETKLPVAGETSPPPTAGETTPPPPPSAGETIPPPPEPEER